MRSTSLLLLAATVCGTVGSARAAEPGREPLVEQVRRAITRGVEYLRSQEQGQGNWEHVERSSIGHRGGHTALAMLALLNCGVKADDPLIQRGLAYLRQLETQQTYVVALQTMVFAEAGKSEDRERIQRNVNWLLSTRVMEGGRLLGWSYGHIQPGTLTDNSNTQYALLGLHAGHLAGARIDRKDWEAVREFYVRTQQPDHGWVYNRAISGARSTLTMTTAGLSGLLISGMELNAGREEILQDGTARNCGVYEENRPVANALGWIGRHFRIELPADTSYSIYGIERAGRLSGLRFFGEHDWYREGCEYLVRTQNPDNGSWRDKSARGNSNIVCTSFSLLFLSKGRTPVLVSKLVHGPGDDWNNDRYDARNLVDYCARELFRKQPLAWQIFDARRVEVRTNEELRHLVADLLQSPIVYFNGHEAPRFTDVEKSLLKQYLDQGGFLFAEACCGRREFDQGFRQLMRELFPETPLKPLPAEHPVWRAHALIPPAEFKLEGIDMGCKTVVIYSPQDLSCLWEANQAQAGRGQLAFRLGGNVVAYATGMEPPKPRLTDVEVLRTDADGKQIPRGFLKVAQLRHDGDWQPAPRAMPNLMSYLRDKARLDVALQTETLRPRDPDLFDFKFLYMHGRAAFTLGNEDVQNLRMDLETGGLLFADACCGKPAFDTAFRALVARLFPDKKLEPIPPHDELYSTELNGTALTSVRCRMEAGGGRGGDYQETPPLLEGVRLGNRWVVIYSKYDVGCALEKHQSTDCLGYDHASALRLGSAVVLYALKR